MRSRITVFAAAPVGRWCYYARMKNLANDEKIALCVFGAVGANFAVEKWYKHPTSGNGIKALVAALSVAG